MRILHIGPESYKEYGTTILVVIKKPLALDSVGLLGYPQERATWFSFSTHSSWLLGLGWDLVIGPIIT